MSRNPNNFGLLLTTLVLLSWPNVALALVSQIVFTTDSQTIAPDSVSEAITIQTQDEGGSLFKTPETIDLDLVSTSPTGEFVGKTGKVDSRVTMSKNTGNRTVYYQDSTEGSFEITITATGRESGTSWSASQTITISSEAVSPVPKAEVKKTEPKKEPPKAIESKPATTTLKVVAPLPPKEVVQEKPVEKKPEKKPEVKKVPEQAAAVVLSTEKATTTEVLYEAPRKQGFFAKIWIFFKKLFS